MYLKKLIWIYASILCLLTISTVLYAQETLSGTIFDEKTHEPIAGAQIIISGTSEGTVSDANGYFELKLPNPNTEVTIRYLGYETLALTGRGQHLKIGLVESVNTLNQVVISANRLEQQRVEIPAAISVIGSEDMQRAKATQLDQLLNKMTGVYMSNLMNESHTMSIRSPLSYRAIFLYAQDGIPARPTGDFSHTTLKELDMASFKRIEVIRGPNSAIFGSEAIGGVVNAITSDPAAVPSGRVSLQGNNIGYKRAELNLSNTFHNTGVFIGGHYGQSRNGWRDHSDMDKVATTLKVKQKISDNTRATLSANFVSLNSDATGNLDSATFFHNTDASLQTFTYSDTKVFRSSLNVLHQWSAKSYLSSTLFYRNLQSSGIPQYRIRDDRRDPTHATGEIKNDGFQSYGAIVQQITQFDWCNSRWLIGGSMDFSPAYSYRKRIDITKDEDGRYISFTDQDEIFEDYDVNYVNVSAQTQFELSPIDKLRLAAALRYDYFKYSYTSTEELSIHPGITTDQSHFSNLTPKIGATYELSQNRGLYTNYSMGFVPPQIGDVYGADLVNRAMKPQIFHNYEVGGWWYFLAKKGYMDIALYTLQGTNELVTVVLEDGSEENRNVGETSHQGIELGAYYTFFNSLTVRLNGAYALHKYKKFDTGEESYDGKLMECAPKLLANGAISYAPPQLKGFFAELEYQHMGEYFMSAENNNAEVYPGFDLLNFRTGYTLQGKMKGLEIWLNILNLTDELYAEISDISYGRKRYRPANPRNFNLGLQYTFGH